MLFLLLSITMLASCTKREYYTDESATDPVVLKFQAVGSTFDPAARQPELMQTIFADAQKLIGYNKVSELGQIGNYNVAARGKARGQAIGELLLAISRQPELADAFEKWGIQMLGIVGDQTIDPVLNQYSILALQPSLSLASARQPELIPTYYKVVKDMVGVDLSK